MNPDAYLVGEIWKVDPRWVGDRHFDGLMNYPLRETIINYLAHSSIDTTHFVEQLNYLAQIYPSEHTLSAYNLLGSHDTERVLTMLAGDKDRLKLAYLIQFAFPGAPAIYYGDEIGMAGGKDPDCRATFPWNEAQWDLDLRNHLKALIKARNLLPALHRGGFKVVYSDNRRHCFAFARQHQEQIVLVVINADMKRHMVRIPISDVGFQDGQILYDALGNIEVQVNEGAIVLQVTPLSGAWIV